MFEDRCIWSGNNFVAIFDQMTIEVHKKSAKSHVIRRNVKIEFFEVWVSKASKTAWSVKPVEIIDQKQGKMLALIFELFHYLSQGISCKLVLILAKVDYFLKVLWGRKFCTKSFVIKFDQFLTLFIIGFDFDGVCSVLGIEEINLSFFDIKVLNRSWFLIVDTWKIDLSVETQIDFEFVQNVFVRHGKVSEDFIGQFWIHIEQGWFEKTWSFLLTKSYLSDWR